MQAPLPASLGGPCAFTASHLEPSDNRATLVPLYPARPRAWAGPCSGPEYSARWRPPVGCALRWWPPTEALRVPSEPGWSPRARVRFTSRGRRAREGPVPGRGQPRGRAGTPDAWTGPPGGGRGGRRSPAPGRSGRCSDGWGRRAGG